MRPHKLMRDNVLFKVTKAVMLNLKCCTLFVLCYEAVLGHYTDTDKIIATYTFHEIGIVIVELWL